jgi:glycosyltransferase involved in cell wall biosynthesis
MKFAVYTITKNEEQFIQRWADSCSEADYILVVDTGSTDDTVNLAVASGCEVDYIDVRPWRFDDARNASLALLPSDIDMCIALDADEVLQPGWREHLESLDPGITRPRYRYVWSWNQDGSPGLIYGGDKIHSRFGYRWKHPVHETLTPSIDEVQGWCGLEIHHHPDNSKPRSQYFPLLELAAKESPNCDRTAHYLAREYFFHGRLAEAAQEFLRHIDLPSAVWAPERAKSMRYMAKCRPSEAEKWLLRATAEDPYRREPWVDMASHYYKLGRWAECYAAIVRALSITERSLDYLSESDAWGSYVYDIGCVAAWHLGLLNKSLEYISLALEIEPENQRFLGNKAMLLSHLGN